MTPVSHKACDSDVLVFSLSITYAMIICGEQYVYLIFIVIMLKLIVSFSFIVNMLKLVVVF